MKTSISRMVLLSAICLTIALVNTSYGQNNYTIVKLTVVDKDSLNVSDIRNILVFGVHASATYCKDQGLDVGGYTEIESPPVPPGGNFDARFTDFRGVDACPGEALTIGVGMKVFIQEPAKKDTFKLSFQASDAGYPFKFSWGSQPWIATDWDTLRLIDPFTGGILVNVNMLTDTAYWLTNNLLNSLYIIGTSKAAGTLGVEREGQAVPTSFSLEQNYPNPFNPSTTIKFAVEKTAFTEVAVYNVIGQKVKTLAAEVLTPGFYTTTWHGTDDNGQAVTTGVYFVRMVATGENAGFSDLRKLLLLK